MIKSLIITAVRFWEQRQGCDVYIGNKFNFVNGEKYLLFIGKISKKEKAQIKAKYGVAGIKCIHSFTYQFTRYLRAFLSLIRLNVFYSLQKPYRFSAISQNKIKKYVVKNGINTVICEYVWFANTVKKIPENVVKVIDTHDIQYKFCENYRKINKHYKPNITEADELAIYKKFDLAVAVSTADYKYFSEKLDNAFYLPFVFTPKPFVKVESDVLNIGFIGGSADFNVHAAEWFIQNVMTSDKLNVQLNIYGRVCDKLSDNNKNVKLWGVVENLDDCYNNNHLIINPTFLIGGIKTKNVEALSYGKIVLTTSEGARGLEAFDDGTCLFVANTGEEYVDIILKFQNDIELCNTYGAEIIERFKQNFSSKRMDDFNKLIEDKITAKEK